MKKISLAGFLILLLSGCVNKHNLPPVSGDLTPINSSEVMTHE